MSNLLEKSIVKYFPKELHDLALGNLKLRLEDAYWSGRLNSLEKHKGDLDKDYSDDPVRYKSKRDDIERSKKDYSDDLVRYNDDCSVDDETVTYVRNERIENES